MLNDSSVIVDENKQVIDRAFTDFFSKYNQDLASEVGYYNPDVSLESKNCRKGSKSKKHI